jgi:hypothetical protein
MFEVMQHETRRAIVAGIVPKESLTRVLEQGLVGKEFIDDVVRAIA